MPEDNSHSLISPSMLWRILGSDACYASVTMQQKFPEQEAGDAARLGTRLHEEAEMALLFGDNHGNELVQQYLDYVRGIASTPHQIIPEKKVSLRRFVKDMKGTADAVVVNEGHLHVIDFKTGMGRVAVEENPQLMAYALGVLEELTTPIKSITLHIAQPAISYLQGWKVSKKALKQFGRDLKEAAALCFEDSPVFSPTEDNCRWCSAAPNCDALKKKMTAIMKDDFSGKSFSPVEPENLNDEQLNLLLENKTQIERYLSQCEKHAVNRLLDGEYSEHWKLGYTRTNRRWTPEAEAELERLLGESAFAPRKLIGIGAAEKVLGSKSVVSALTEKPEGGPKLVLKTSSEKEYLIGSDFEALDEK